MYNNKTKNYSLFKTFCEKNIDYYSDTIEKISKSLKDNVDWWVSSTATRNIIDYKLYHEFSIIIYV